MSPIELQGLLPLQRKLNRASAAILGAVADHVASKEAPAMVRTMRSRSGSNKTLRIASSTASMRRTRTGATVVTQAAGLAATVLMGSEFGGRRRVKAYVSRSRNGTPYVLRRHTTMQFGPFLGRHGYWFWPSIRTEARGIRKRVLTVANKAVRDAQ